MQHHPALPYQELASFISILASKESLAAKALILEVPLAPQLAAMLATIPHDESGFLFPGKPKTHMTTAATLKLLQGLHPGKTCHGFRSSFRDWAADNTSYPRDVAEAALAHVIKDKTEAAYRRTTMLEKRANLMQDWATHCYTTVTS